MRQDCTVRKRALAPTEPPLPRLTLCLVCREALPSCYRPSCNGHWKSSPAGRLVVRGVRTRCVLNLPIDRPRGWKHPAHPPFIFPRTQPGVSGVIVPFINLHEAMLADNRMFRADTST